MGDAYVRFMVLWFPAIAVPIVVVLVWFIFRKDTPPKD